MNGRAYLDLARELLLGKTEVHWRAAAGNAYYALMLECRDALLRWGQIIPRGASVHTFVRLRFALAADKDLRKIGDALDELGRLRSRAQYELNPSRDWSSAVRARHATQRASDALALLDGIDNDPARRAAAVASLPP